MPEPIQIAVDGYRAGAAEREMAQVAPDGDLPRLSEEQRAAARRLGIAESDYARSVYAGQRSQDRLLEKGERLGRILETELQQRAPGAHVRAVTLRVFQDRFDVTIEDDGRAIPVRIAEGLVDELFERGSPEAQDRLARIVAYALPSGAR